jgi:hypothetical protein
VLGGSIVSYSKNIFNLQNKIVKIMDGANSQNLCRGLGKGLERRMKSESRQKNVVMPVRRGK